MHNIGKCLVIGLFCLLNSTIYAQQHFRIMEYNVENLFDYEHDSLKQDKEFLPSSLRGWNSFRFYKKVQHIAQVILAATGKHIPDIVGICEIENERCAKALAYQSPLRTLGYKYVITESQDPRGIDVAVFYQPATFRYLGHQAIRIDFYGTRRPTRDVLHIMGQVVSGDTLDVFLLHSPSRANGKKASEPYRIAVAQKVKHIADSICHNRKAPHILIMGDFNDTAQNKSLQDTWQSIPPQEPYVSSHYYNLFAGEKKGTFKYKGEWELLDHILVNGRMLQENSRIRIKKHTAQIFSPPFLLTTDKEYGGKKPFKTYHGMKYQGGFSDHLPLIVDVEIDIPQTLLF